MILINGQASNKIFKADVIWIKNSMIRKLHNHKLQTTPWHREEEPFNHHETPGRQIKQSKQLSLLPFKMIAILEST